ncbi:MAG: hypothetical protein JWN98_300 [Abditibacteriota bacterium]|nr:hypothetical protein [Abditibacteriota bacterium]
MLYVDDLSARHFQTSACSNNQAHVVALSTWYQERVIMIYRFGWRDSRSDMAGTVSSAKLLHRTQSVPAGFFWIGRRFSAG